MDSPVVYTGLALAVGGLALLYGALSFWSPPPIVTHESERFYKSRASPKKRLPLSRLEGPSSVDLTIVVPAFNETERLPIMMQDTIRYLESSATLSLGKKGVAEAKTVANGSAKANGKSEGSTGVNQRKTSSKTVGSKRTVEIIIVDDGSTDKTSSVALDLAKKYASYDIRVVTLEKNIGKGGAVRHGMLHSSGERLLMADADGASRIDDLEALWNTMDELSGEDNGPAVVVGSRAHLVKTEAVVKRSFIRNVLMYGLHTVLRIVGVGHIRDTQCGFKLFSRSAAQQIFPSQHLPTWIFDVELLLLAKYLRIPVAEVPIEWHEVAGSKLNVITASVQMLRDLLIVRANHMLGIWKPVPVKKVE